MTLLLEGLDLDRRDLLRKSGKALGGIALGGPSLFVAACGNGDPATARSRQTFDREVAAGPWRDFRLVAEPGEVEVGRDTVYRTWLYNGRFPGPAIRAGEGERLRIAVENRLPEVGTTVHWHGIPVPNAMDGVPGLTQEPIPPGGHMTYEYGATPAGSYMYHSHMDLQLERGLVGPLIIEEHTPHITYDREHILMFDDFLPGVPKPLEELARSGENVGGGMMGGMMGRGRGNGSAMGGMSGVTPPYAGLLINGRLPSYPSEFAVRRGERARLRLINPSSATTYRIAIAGHPMIVTHADGQPVEPVTVDRLTLGMGERYDVIVEASSPGVWPIVAVPVEGNAPPARALLRYTDAGASGVRDRLPEGLSRGRALRYADLQSTTPLPANGSPDRTFDLRLSGGMMMRPAVWTIDGQAYPDAEPLEIREGERVRVNMSNMSMMLHPMHLHGHFFRVGNALKDTIIVEPHMGRASFEFVADNPGRWLFHCHNLYHLHAGMAREFRYL
ncbi:MAG: multicopper oxidase family protein [Qipengyuania sp.]